MQTKEIRFEINGKMKTLSVPVHRTLLEMIREDLGLTGAKECCDEGECGACTVIMDGKAVTSCCILAVQADGRKIVTIEGLQKEDRLDPVQQAFIDTGSVQCGYCTPGMILSAKALLDQNPDPDEKAIRTALEGNLCRCTGYDRIVKGVQLAIDYMKKESA